MDLVFSDGTSYKQLVRSIEAKSVLLKDATTAEGKFFCMRHDIDIGEHFNRMHDFAKVEAELGIKATYCIMYKSAYMDLSGRSLPRIKKIHDMGHEIALHVNAVGAVNNGENVKDIIRAPLKFLRKNGIPVCGVSAHGDAMFIKRKWSLNYEFWKEYDPKKNQGVGGMKWNKIPLEEFGLTYEAYLMDFNMYLCDSGRKWRGLIKEQGKMFPWPGWSRELVGHGKGIIKKFNTSDARFLQVLTHPHSLWKVKT